MCNFVPISGFVSVVYILCEQNIKFFLFLLDEEGNDVEEGMCVMNSHVNITAKRRKQWTPETFQECLLCYDHSKDQDKQASHRTTD